MPIKHKRVLSAPRTAKGGERAMNGVKNASASYARDFFSPSTPTRPRTHTHTAHALIIDNDFEMNFPQWAAKLI